ncbi:MAG: Fic family protein [Proteobacteria bacterium]|nr:Fic family protein [Pseudomonadota bacterium]
MPTPYSPPFSLTATVLDRVAVICEQVGRWRAQAGNAPSPRLRREQRIRSVQASLAIENNSLSLEQVTAVLDGRPVLAPPREVQEVRNAFAAYERLGDWAPNAAADVLAAHGVLMHALMDAPGGWRSGGVGIYRGKQLMHMAPPASQVPRLMADLLGWLRQTTVHPLVASCVFHYEFEFIHPFADGNGRMGRLWQTLILSRWQPVLAWLPVESVVRDRQADYYAALAAADAASDATVFVEFMLDALATALTDAITGAATSDQVSDHASDQVPPPVAQLLAVLGTGEAVSASELMRRLGLKHRPSFRQRFLQPALAGGWLAMTQPDAPRSPTQTYRRRDTR